MKLTLTSQPRMFTLKCKQENKTPGKTSCISKFYFIWITKSSCNVCRPIKQANKQTSKPDSNTDHYQSWMLPMADAKITLDTGSVMRISCPGFGFQHGDLSASQFWTTKYVSPPKIQFQCNGGKFLEYVEKCRS